MKIISVFYLIILLNSNIYCQTVVSCNNWLNTPSLGSAINLGDLDISGTQITVEAIFNRTTSYTGGYLYAGDIVSKHTDASNVNYLLRPNSAEITTSDGYFLTPQICDIELNKTYHVAMVYDGTALKFYRNGFLMSQAKASGTLFQNNINARIGFFSQELYPEQFIGYINEVRIWNVARTQIQIQKNLNTVLPNPTTQAGLVAYYQFDNLLNKQGNPLYNGVINGNAIINTSNPKCNLIADSCMKVVPTCTNNFDYSFIQDICNPLSIQFNTAGVIPVNPYWDFGDGGISTGIPSPLHNYSTSGNYTVKYHIDNAICTDTITKIISTYTSKANIILTNDTTACYGSSKLLNTLPYSNFCWTPTTFLNNPNSTTPISTPHKNITYYYTALGTGNNLIINGDFSAGNTGFSSDYIYTTTNQVEGEYSVYSNPRSWNPSVSSCVDHTSGNGNMLLVNGSPIAGMSFWSQTINVLPNTNYNFSCWGQTIFSPNPAQLQFSINGVLLGPILTLSSNTCQWTQFSGNWNSGSNTTAKISIKDVNSIRWGNDFAVDDIIFAPSFILQDSVRILVDSPTIKISKPNSAFCAGTPVQLNASGNVVSFSWSPIQGLSNANIATPIVIPFSNIQYIVSGITINGCSIQDSITVSVLPGPKISKSPDTIICQNNSIQLFASGGNIYSWSPTSTLNNPNIATPIATPVNYTTTYYVNVTNSSVNNCITRDSIKVVTKPLPVFSIVPDISTCIGTSPQLMASGGDTYSWSPANLVSDPNIANPIAITNNSTLFKVLISDKICNLSKTLSVNAIINPGPQLIISKTNDINCNVGSTNLLASGASKYTWTPSFGLNNNTISNPIAQPTLTTTYTVIGTDSMGCSNIDSITVYVTNDGKSGYYIANTFTPNGDGINDCFGIKYWGIFKSLTFIIYNRWGEKVFSTNDANSCWDGNYKSQKSPIGNYVYYINAQTTCGNVEKKGNVLLLR